MKSGKTAGHGNGHPSVPNRTQAKRAGPKLEAGPEASAERSEGTMEARMGRDAAGGSMRYAHDSATGHVFGRGRPDFKARCTSSFTKHREAEPVVPVIAAVWPIRRSLRGAKHRAAGMARRAFPWRQAQRPSGREGITPSRQGAGWILQPASTAKSSSGSSAYHAHTTPKARWAGRTR